MSASSPSSPFLLSLRKAILADAKPEIVLALKVAVLRAGGYRRSEIARRLDDSTPAQLRVAYGRVDRVAERLDQGDAT